MPTSDELRALQKLPLEAKVLLTKQRIREWVDYWGKDHVCVSFSGGKDSTVLLHIVREMYGNDIPAVFVNTGLEFPEIQRHVRTFENVTILTPDEGFRDVITKYGYPVVSKDVAEDIETTRRYRSQIVHAERERQNLENVTHESPETSKLSWDLVRTHAENRLSGTSKIQYLFGVGAASMSIKENIPKWSRYAHTKYIPLLDADFKISGYCCTVMKKRPIKAYQKPLGMAPFVGTLAEESVRRKGAWLRSGCNAFNGSQIRSVPLSFWTEQDILRYIVEKHIEIADVYGDIVADGRDGQICMGGCGKLKCTGSDRTGCIFCAFGAQKGQRFVELAKTHPKQYAYCMNGGAYDPEDGFWKPTKEGLGMAHVFDEMNRLLPTKNGKPFIRYLPEGGEMERAKKLAEEKGEKI